MLSYKKKEQQKKRNKQPPKSVPKLISVQKLLTQANISVGCVYTHKFSFALKGTLIIVFEQEKSNKIPQ